MNDKDCMDKLAEATDRLGDVTEKLGKTIDKMLDYCVLVSLMMFITIVIAFIF